MANITNIMKPTILFILKRREDYDQEKHSPQGLSTGLYNSASFMRDMLLAVGVDARLEVAIDNNCIDRLVTKHKPTHVIIEALWVVPSKFTILSQLHKSVTWIIRLHSELPFLAGEGMAMDWIGDYSKYPNIIIGINAPRLMEEVKVYLQIKNNLTDEELKKKVVYLPNYYPQNYVRKEFDNSKETIDVCCFGAVRPFKNHMIQAIAALKFAKVLGKKLNFHINSGRTEMKGEPVLSNLRAMFQHLYDQGHSLTGHEWTPREEFLKTCASMDIGMQVSFSETFNIVGADIVSQGVPLVGSIEIPWMSTQCTATPQNHDEIVNTLLRSYDNPQANVKNNQQLLTHYTNKTQKIWVNYFTHGVTYAF
jgi:hypothetical protein